MRRSIATVSLSGTLEEKLRAAADAGFDGVEVFENDLISSPLPPRQIRDLASSLGLSIDLYQPFRDFEGVGETQLAANLRRAEAKFALMVELGADTLLVCSNATPDAVDNDALVAEQLHRLAETARPYGVRIAYEALAWGTHVATYGHTWDLVRRADHPGLGVCLDSFHVLSRGDDPAGIREIPGEDLLPAAGRRTQDGHGRTAVEPAPPVFPRSGRLRPDRVHRPRARGRVPGAAVAGGLQRRLPGRRHRPDRSGRAPLARGPGGRSDPAPGGSGDPGPGNGNRVRGRLRIRNGEGHRDGDRRTHAGPPAPVAGPGDTAAVRVRGGRRGRAGHRRGPRGPGGPRVRPHPRPPFQAGRTVGARPDPDPAQRRRPPAGPHVESGRGDHRRGAGHGRHRPGPGPRRCPVGATAAPQARPLRDRPARRRRPGPHRRVLLPGRYPGRARVDGRLLRARGASSPRAGRAPADRDRPHRAAPALRPVRRGRPVLPLGTGPDPVREHRPGGPRRSDAQPGPGARGDGAADRTERVGPGTGRARACNGRRPAHRPGLRRRLRSGRIDERTRTPPAAGARQLLRGPGLAHRPGSGHGGAHARVRGALRPGPGDGRGVLALLHTAARRAAVLRGGAARRGYEGFGARNTPVRMALHRAERAA